MTIVEPQDKLVQAVAKIAQAQVAHPFLQELLDCSLIPAEDWLDLPEQDRDGLASLRDRNDLLDRLAELELLTPYQASRIAHGTTQGLILGNYRLLQRLGAGSMGVVYLAEHLFMRRKVAIKLLTSEEVRDSRQVTRFYSEVRAVSRIEHPNIVNALDAGVIGGAAPEQSIHFFVMEYVAGKDLEAYVRDHGPLSIAKACEVIHQIAGALDAAHGHNLIHRDIKPSNIIVNPQGQSKLLDFGLARQFRKRLTDPGTFLGTPDYMAPEQIRDSSCVDRRADIFGLGGVLYWCLTGKSPFPFKKNFFQELMNRSTTPPPSARNVRPEVPAGLDEVMARMMAMNPDDRYPNSQAVMQALLSFLSPDVLERIILSGGRPGGSVVWTPTHTTVNCPRVYRVLIVDDDRFTRTFCKSILSAEGIECAEAGTGMEALEEIKKNVYDLVLLDVQMPGMTGGEVCQRLRAEPPWPNLKILMLSASWKSDEMAGIMLAGANDFLTKPTTKLQLLARVKAALELKEAQDRSDALNQQLLASVHELGQTLQSREVDIMRGCKGFVLALQKIAVTRGIAAPGRLLRLQHYCRRLAEEVAETPSLRGQIDQNFVDMIAICAPLQDIGNMCLPDHIVRNPSKLTLDEYVLVQTHTEMGAAVLQEVAEQYNFSPAFLQMAVDIARHHHERFDGEGYPARLKGTDIPLPARIVAIADAYDAIRSRRPYKPPLSHTVAVDKMKLAGGQFDPVVLQGFFNCASFFDQIFSEMMD